MLFSIHMDGYYCLPRLFSVRVLLSVTSSNHVTYCVLGVMFVPTQHPIFTPDPDNR